MRYGRRRGSPFARRRGRGREGARGLAFGTTIYRHKPLTLALRSSHLLALLLVWCIVTTDLVWLRIVVRVCRGPLKQLPAGRGIAYMGFSFIAVSYTHLTLPTKA